MNHRVEALCFSRYTHEQWQLARKVAKTTAHADMRKQLSLDPLSQRCLENWTKPYFEVDAKRTTPKSMCRGKAR